MRGLFCRWERPESRKRLAKRFEIRTGITKTELIVSTMLLVVVMSVTATMFHNVNQVWKDIRHHRIASSELANQLDELTRLDRGEIAAAIKDLKPSAICNDALPESTLSATMVKDVLGERIDLEIQWRGRYGTRSTARSNRANLSGWLTGGMPK